ncbi:MAG TPA: phosphatidate cytidylyltransferase [Candidatus Limnocylindrales bacterium]|nr:phosphatidate cytidylyltransferase [Candidatus Limnocylindrales bacterium]
MPSGRLRQRATSAAFLVPPLVVALLLGGVWIVAVIAVATALAAREAFHLLTSAGYPSLAWLGVAFATALVLDAAVVPAIDSSGVLLIAIGSILAAVGAFTRTDPRDGLPTWFGTVFGALYASLLAFVLRLGHAAPAIPAGAPLASLFHDEPGRGWILLLVLAVWSYDTGAYFVGKRFGRRRFLSHLSPSKTYAGLIGGIVAATIVVALVLAALGQAPAAAVLLGPLLALAAQAGDLAESMLKRAAGAKDSGTLIPGHGGILDRVDSFLFAAPVALLYVLAAYR